MCILSRDVNYFSYLWAWDKKVDKLPLLANLGNSPLFPGYLEWNVDACLSAASAWGAVLCPCSPGST